MSGKPAEPTLASTIYSASLSTSQLYPEDATDDYESTDAQRKRKRRRVVGTGCKTLDETLRGGLVYGSGGLCCVSGEQNAGVGEIAQSLLVSHLVSSGSGTATIVDVRGTFDVRKLHEGLIQRIEGTASNNSHAPPGQHLEQAPESAADKAKKMLDRVRMMRVFDLDGMLEGLAELKEDLEQRASAATLPLPLPDGQEESVPRIKSTIADSQDEGEEMLDDMLDGGVSVGPAGDGVDTEVDNEELLDDRLPDITTSDGAQDTGNVDSEQVHMLIVDNLTQIISPMMKNNYLQGQGLLTSVLRSLGHTAREHNMCIVLLNSTVTYKDDQEGPSAFSSISSRPALGKTVGYMVDAHLLINRLSRGQKGASTTHGRGEGKVSSGNPTQWVNALEVVQDREGDRVGRVAFFTVDDYGRVKEAF